jgi:hypothetical protein
MFDTQHVLKDAGEVTSSGYGTVDAAAQVLDLGFGLVRGNLILEISRLAMQGNDQTYSIHLMGGDDESFTNTVSLAILEVGPAETIQDNKDSKLGRYIVPFENQRNGVIYPYVRVRHVLGGTGPVLNYQGRLEKDLPITGMISTATTTTTTV